MELGAGCHCVLGPLYRGDRAAAFTALEAGPTRNLKLHELEDEKETQGIKV
jgi:hypothetical protein